jgi:DNA-binding transcriptional LysR family regulator
MPSPLLKGLTLRGLEVFETLARNGSVAATATELGMSAPAVSQQMKNLSAALGADLVDASRRPMTLTPAGRMFLGQAKAALKATRLADAMSQCAFVLQTGPSHLLQARIASREMDMVIAAAGRAAPAGTVALPLLEDPYILAVPKGTDVSDGLAGLEGLPLLRRDLEQIMGKQIEAWLTRAGAVPAKRFEMDSNQSISAMVAAGQGWTITTPLSLMRAGRFASGIDAHPLPGEAMARQIVLYATSDWSGGIPEQIAELARELIGQHFWEPGLEQMPWLGESFRVLG